MSRTTCQGAVIHVSDVTCSGHAAAESRHIGKELRVSLSHGLLGLLAEGPASGYDLARRFTDVLGVVWPAKHPTIYTELGRLVERELIEVESEGPRGRKAYRITDAGLTEIRRWLTEEPTDHVLRSESLFRAVFLWLLTPEQIATHLESEAAYFEQMAATYRTYAEAKDRGEFGTAPQTQSLRVVIEAGERLHRALAEWVAWAQTVPPAAPAGDEKS